MSANHITTQLEGEELVTARRAVTADLACMISSCARLSIEFEDISRLHEDARLQQALGGWPFDPVDSVTLDERQAAALLEIAMAETEADRATEDLEYAAALTDLLDRHFPVEDAAV